MKRVLLLVAAAVLALGLYVVLGTNPLETGSVSAQDPSGLDPAGEFYSYAPNTDYYVMTGIRNAGSLPVTVKGPHPRREPEIPGPYAAEFLLARGTDPTAQIAARSGATPFSGINVSPGEEVWVWIRFHTGPCPADGSLPFPPGSGAVVKEVLVDWAIFGVPRVSSVPFIPVLDVRNVGSYDLCNQ